MPDPGFTAQFLALVALIGSTIEYCEIMRRRVMRREEAVRADEAAAAGLVGLVRVFAADAS